MYGDFCDVYAPKNEFKVKGEKMRRKDLLDKIEECYIENKNNKEDFNLSINMRDLRYIRLWIKTAYQYEEVLDEEIGLDK